MNTTKTCPHCQKEVDLKATKCPHCRSDLRIWARRHPIATLLIVAIVAPVIMSQVGQPYSYTPAVEQIDIVGLKKNTIESFSRSYIKNSLKAPTTAKFNYFPSIKPDPKDPNLFEVISDVTSENSYGAKLTSPWSLKAKYIGADTSEAIEDGSNWRITEVYFDGEKVK